MKLEIKHIETFNFIKGLLDAYYRNTGAACYNEVNNILTQMDKAPATDDEGYFIEESQTSPTLDDDFCFKYRGFDFELTSCTIIHCKNDVLNVTEENIKQRFPRGFLTDRYVCWMHGHRDIDGYTLQEYLKQYPNETEDKNCFNCNVYLVPEAWTWDAEYGLAPGKEVDKIILKAIDKFIESKGIDNL